MRSKKSNQSSRTRSSIDTWLIYPEVKRATVAADRLLNGAGSASGSLLYVHGAPGSGKTHFLQRFVTLARKSKPRLHTETLTSTAFAELLRKSRSGRSLHGFADRFSGVHLLAIEDLQFLATKNDAQQRLAFLIDEITSRGNKVVLTATALPGSLRLSARLRNRCHGGMFAELQNPSIQSRKQIISHLSQTSQLPMTPHQIDLIARRRDANTKQLADIVHQLERAQSRLTDSRFDTSTIERVLARFDEPPEPQIAAITRVVARHFGVTVKELKSLSREHRLTLPRQLAMYLCREMTSKPIRDVARHFGRDNHSAVSHAHRRIRSRLSKEPDLKQHIAHLQDQLQ